MDNVYFYFSFSALFNALVSIFLGLFTLLRNRRDKVNKIFSLFCFTVAIWSMPYVFWPLAKTKEETLLAFQLLHFGACFISILYFHFVTRWLETFNKNRLFVYLGYILAIFFSLSIPTRFFINDMIPKFSMRYWAEPGILYHFYLLMFFGYFLYSSFLLFTAYKNETGIKRQQIKFVLIGMVLGFLGGSTNYFLWYNINIPPYGNILASSFVIFTAYAILRYRLMDMRVIARIFLIYAIDAVFVYAFYSVLIVVYPILWGSLYSNYAILAGVIVTPVFVVFIFWFHNFVTGLVDKYFFYSLYDYKKTISAVTKELNNYNDLNKIVDLIVGTIKKTMGLNRAGVLLADKPGDKAHYKIAKVIGFDVTNGISLVKDNFLTKYLKNTAKPLVREELSYISQNTKSSKDAKALLNLEESMKHIEASLCVPLIKGNQLMGIIVLGTKESGDPYTNDDLNLLSTLSMQAAVALDNAQMYQEVKNFNKSLQKKVDEQTQELQKRADHLEKLLKMREEFLDIASHQLKTPVSVIRGTLSMFRDGSMDKLSKEEQHKFMDNIYHKTEKLNIIISDILRASEIESEDFKIDPNNSKKAQLEEILQSIHGDLKDVATDKKLKLELTLPKKKTAPILTSADFLEQAIFNLVDNAIKYTQTGFVKIDFAADGKDLTVKISDSGIGIPQADQKKLFDKFTRARNAVNMYTDGSGLGLFIAKKIIEAHSGGSLSFESKEGAGTTFTIKLRSV